MGNYIPYEEVEQMVKDNDDDGNGLLDFTEFVQMLTGNGPNGHSLAGKVLRCPIGTDLYTDPYLTRTVTGRLVTQFNRYRT